MLCRSLKHLGKSCKRIETSTRPSKTKIEPSIGRKNSSLADKWLGSSGSIYKTTSPLRRPTSSCLMTPRHFHSSPLILSRPTPITLDSRVSSNGSDEHPALLAQIRELIASDNHSYAAQVLKQSGLTVESFGVPLALEAMKVFEAVDEFSSKTHCAAYVFNSVENPPMSVIAELTMNHCYSGKTRKALEFILNRKASALLVSLKLPETTNYTDLFDILAHAGAQGSLEAVELLTLYRTVFRFIGDPNLVSASCKAILKIAPEDTQSVVVHLFARATKASELNHPKVLSLQELFLQEVTAAAKPGSDLSITMLLLDALSLLNKHHEVAQIVFADLENIEPSLVPWLLTSQAALGQSFEYVSEELYKPLFGSTEELDAFLDDPEQVMIVKLQIARFFLMFGKVEETRRILFEKLLSSEKIINIDECQAFINFANTSLTDFALRLEVLEALVKKVPVHGTLLTKTAWECTRTKAFDRALTYYSKAEHITVLSEVERFYFANSFEMTGLFEEALARYAELGLNGRIRTASVLVQQHKYDDAVKVYNEVIQQRPSTASQPLALSDVYATMDSDWAPFFANALEERYSPSHRTPPEYIDYEKGLMHLLSLIATFDTIGIRMPAHYELVAKCLSKLGRNAEALEWVERAKLLPPVSMPVPK